MTDNKQKPESVNDDDVMITSSISELEKMLENADKRTDSKFERMFLPALAVFSAIIMGFFIVIYSITSDMTRLADSMDPDMGGNMSSMVSSINKLANNVDQMTTSVAQMQKSFSRVEKDMDIIAIKLNSLDSIAVDLTQVSVKMDSLEPMLINMEEMNKNMTTMQDSMQWMQRDLNMLRSSFSKPLRIFNKIPML
jgi:phage-related minor tail protein